MAKIVLAESFQLIRPLISSILQKSGHEVICASSAAQMVGMVSDMQPDLILFDLDMPLCGGTDAVRYLRRLRHGTEVRILGITAHRNREFLVGALRSGVNVILLKEEFTAPQLLERIAHLLATPLAPAPSAAESGGAGLTGAAAQARAAEQVRVPAAVAAQPVETPAVITPGSAILAVASPAQACPPPLKIRQFEEALPRILNAKALRPIVHQVIAMTGNPNTTVHELTQVLRIDVGLSAKLIAAANSAFYRRKNATVRNLADAVNVIGLSGTRDLAMTLGLADTFQTETDDSALALPGLWGHSISVGHLCEALARRTRACDPEQAFILGLLHDMGRRILAEHFPEHYRHVVHSISAGAPLPPLCELERAVVGIDHAALGSMVMERWGCPSFICKGVRVHHSAALSRDNTDDPLGGLARILLLADAMAIAFGYESDALEELPVVPRQWTSKLVSDGLGFREEVFGTLQELQGLIMSRTDVQFTFPAPWRGNLEQIVVLGSTPQALEPLQMLIGHAYRSAKVVAAGQAELTQGQTLLLADLRSAARAEDAATALAWLQRAPAPASWPMLLVTSLAAGDCQKLGVKGHAMARVAPPLRPSAVRDAVESLLATGNSSSDHPAFRSAA